MKGRGDFFYKFKKPNTNILPFIFKNEVSKYFFLIILCVVVGGTTREKGDVVPFVDYILFEKSLYTSFIPKSDEKKLMSDVRKALAYNKPVKITKKPTFSFKFNPDYSWVFITLYQNGQRPLGFCSKGETLQQTLNTIIYQFRQSDRYQNFDVINPSKVRIGFEIITTPFKKVDVSKLSWDVLDSNRFEIGVDGLKIETKDKIGFFTPTDGYVRNKLYLEDVIKWIEHRYNVKAQNCNFYKFNSRSFITYKDDVLGLYRGYPVKEIYTTEDLRKAVLGGLNWLIKHQKENGRFIYFVDSITGETKNYLYERSNLLKELGMKRYYNILRHSGALLSLLQGYEKLRKERYLIALEKGLKYLANTAKIRKLKNGKKGAYIFFNKKAKLGGSGLALIAFSRYQQIIKNDEYYKLSKRLARHLLAEIKKDGEFNYYYIHPLQGKKLESYFFSFYYPGEALLGLAEFYNICNSKSLKKKIIQKTEKALDFLLFIRPKKYHEYYKSLPSDSWLMSAILKLSRIPQLDKYVYKQFVYSDAMKMVTHQYTYKDALYPDYVGGFYYNYGDHVYPDAARSEGLFSAYELAKREGKSTLANLFFNRLKLAALCQLHLVNTEESIYLSRKSNIALGGIRFKLTRQWFRIDTIQHVVSFYMRLLKEMNNTL